MSQEDLIPLTERSPEEAFIIRSKGGRTVSDKQQYKSMLNGLLKRKNISDETKHMLLLLKMGKMSELLSELVSMDLKDSEEDVKRRDHAIDTILRSQPQRVVSMNINKEVFDDDLFNVDEHLKKILGKED